MTPRARMSARRGPARALRPGRLPLGGLGALEAAGLGLLLVVVPVVFDPFARSGYLAVKVLAAGIGVGLIGLSLAWSRALAVPWGKAAAAAGGALVLVVAATAASPSFERSLLGAPQRMSGALMWMFLAVAFAVGFSLRRLRGESADAAIMALGVVAVLAVGLFAVLEAVGVGWGLEAVEFEGRLRSTLANPAVLASFAVLVGPLCIAAAVSAPKWRWPALGACGLAGAMLVGSQSRGAIAAFAATAAVFVAMRASRQVRVRAVASAGVLLAATLAVGRWGDTGFGFRGRAAIWEVAAETIAARPLLGVGPEMFLIEYSERVGEATVREFGRYGATDRAHSGLLDFAVSSGVPAAVLYLAVLAAVGVMAARAMASPQPALAALGAGLLAYAVQQQVFFPHPATDAVFWLLAGVLAAAVGARARPLRSWPIMAAAALVVAGTLANSWSLIRNDHDFERASTAETHAVAYQHLTSAADRRSFDDEPYILMGALLQSADDIGLIAEGEARLRRGESLNPGNETVSLALAEVRLQGFRVSNDPGWAHRSRSGLDRLIGSQPTNGTAYLKRGAAHYYLGDLASAESDWERAAWLLPDDPTPADNLEVLRQQQSAGR
ncbi:O-antigen ligase family protein [Candidatus Poriferisocius sp.]|uniref:O-antigen ligase family protein n=1 Tax=Candidatus Poriferisocius sp. TaxID=3101276 RepID=UPI003B51E2DD